MEKRYVTMCRCETANKAEINRQEQVLEEFVKHEGGSIVRSFIEYGSADILKLRTLRAMAIDGAFDTLLFEKLEVFGYAPDEVREEVKFLNEHGVKVVSITEGELSPEDVSFLFRKQFTIC